MLTIIANGIAIGITLALAAGLAIMIYTKGLKPEELEDMGIQFD